MPLLLPGPASTPRWLLGSRQRVPVPYCERCAAKLAPATSLEGVEQARFSLAMPPAGRRLPHARDRTCLVVSLFRQKHAPRVVEGKDTVARTRDDRD
jgi:hypothetical protein